MSGATPSRRPLVAAASVFSYAPAMAVVLAIPTLVHQAPGPSRPPLPARQRRGLGASDDSAGPIVDEGNKTASSMHPAQFGRPTSSSSSSSFEGGAAMAGDATTEGVSYPTTWASWLLGYGQHG